ncbi:hypothetical protein ACFVYR_25015 [Streptomyces sp. NPDC058284]|uniref:hypothetical protein n=1 Tax=Streptomyces sp. NPDC058284 TaxID=3346421 RepID=UPI0036EEC19C
MPFRTASSARGCTSPRAPPPTTSPRPCRTDATIGFLIGARHNKAAVQLALDAGSDPMAVTSYSTLAPKARELVPSEDDLARVVQVAIDGVQPSPGAAHA